MYRFGNYACHKKPWLQPIRYDTTCCPLGRQKPCAHGVSGEHAAATDVKPLICNVIGRLPQSLIQKTISTPLQSNIDTKIATCCQKVCAFTLAWTAYATVMSPEKEANSKPILKLPQSAFGIRTGFEPY